MVPAWSKTVNMMELITNIAKGPQRSVGVYAGVGEHAVKVMTSITKCPTPLALSKLRELRTESKGRRWSTAR